MTQMTTEHVDVRYFMDKHGNIIQVAWDYDESKLLCRVIRDNTEDMDTETYWQTFEVKYDTDRRKTSYIHMALQGFQKVWM